MLNIFNHLFMVYALIIGLSLGMGAALLSSFLVLNKQSLISDGLSHVAFTGIIIGLLIFPNQPIYIALPIAIIASIFMTFLSSIKMIEHDSAIGVISAFSLALGLMIVSLAKEGFNTDISSLLTGSILAQSLLDVILSVLALIMVLVFILIFYRKLLSSSYDTTYAKFSNINDQFLKYILSALTATFTVLGVRTVGMLLISSFIIFPSLIASQFAKSFKQNVLLSVLISFLVVGISMIGNFTLSIYRIVDLPTGSTIVVLYFIVLMFSILYRKFKL